MNRIALVSVALAALAGAARADVAKAKKLNTQGMQAYGQHRYSAALDLFRAAIAEDPTSVKAHYNAASVLSLMGQVVEAGKELDVLAASKDPAAAKALVKARTDPDLDRASTEAHVREVLGLPAIDTMKIDALLLERAGKWGEDSGACGEAILLTFKKNGTFAYHTEFACDDVDHVEDLAGTWKVAKDTVVLKGDKAFDGATLTVAGCSDVSTAVCLQYDGHDMSGPLFAGDGKQY
jgi:hypothetical protein